MLSQELAMPATPSPDLSPASALLAALAILIGPVLAPYASAYSLILMGWCAGVLIGIYLWPPSGQGKPQMPALVFAIVTLLLVLGVTVPVSRGVALGLASHFAWLDWVSADALLFPTAVLVPAIGHRWPAIIRGLFRFLLRRPRAKEGRDDE